MAASFRSLVGVQPSTASTADSTLVIIDAQNEYASGLLKTENIDSTRRAISALLEKYRAAGGSLVHVVHEVPNGAPVFTPGTELADEFAELKPSSGEKVWISRITSRSFRREADYNDSRSFGRNILEAFPERI
jgi:nicotinamidase-related amidase